jgi:hypothetical protein
VQVDFSLRQIGSLMDQRVPGGQFVQAVDARLVAHEVAKVRAAA